MLVTMPENVQMCCRGTGASWTSWQLIARRHPPTCSWHRSMPSVASQHSCSFTRGGGWTRCSTNLCSNHTCVLLHTRDMVSRQTPGPSHNWRLCAYDESASLLQFSGARPEPAMAQYLEWHMSQVGAQDALLQQRLFAALSHLRQHAPPDAFKQASRCVHSLQRPSPAIPARMLC